MQLQSSSIFFVERWSSARLQPGSPPTETKKNRNFFDFLQKRSQTFLSIKTDRKGEYPILIDPDAVRGNRELNMVPTADLIITLER